jgi:hypothetical protein
MCSRATITAAWAAARARLRHGLLQGDDATTPAMMASNSPAKYQIHPRRNFMSSSTQWQE